MSASVLAIVAHPDDDLLFLNPDLDAGIHAGIPTTVVYVSAGDALLPLAQGAVRARDRRRGIQDAYRISGGVRDLWLQDEWDGEVVELGGRRVEEFRLRQRPGVRVVFLGLPDGRLSRLASGATLTTVPAAGGLVADGQQYDADDVVSVLCGLMERYRPTVLHVTELLADRRYDVPQSHPDHRAATALALDAARRYRAVQDTWLPSVLEHRDYGVGQHPVNLAAATRARKLALFAGAYQPWDPAAADVFGATDRAYNRSSRGTRWSATDGRGAVRLFAVRDGRVVAWTGPGSWQGPVDLGPDGLGAGVTTVVAAEGTDGGIHLAARTDDGRLAVRSVAGGSWTDLGTPNPGPDARYVGSPALAPNADGRLQVVVVNAGGGLSTRGQDADGGWHPWLDLRGADLQDPCDALLDATGRIEVVAASRTGLLLWRQVVPGGEFLAGPLPSLAPASPATFAVNADGRPEVHYRQAGTAAVATSWQDTDLAWRSATALGGHGGTGPTASATVDGRITCVTRNAGGGISVTSQVAPDSHYGPWTDLGGFVPDLPTAAGTPDGRLVVAAVDAGGALVHRIRSAAGEWGPWRAVGPLV
ncbi:PIG-L family deacetylase [Blastococcus sp. VKM Ac-2987]|uniref:PIG-L family deacetylase n=1 Tax=Blastococcus sp. VKM Ac-2987 TaxID=3004141 RepID=UPI0022AB9C5E|nr:PIG-L family deacetylase [Blastococcus sp. VKM Ac-2987]MCZ2860413.1 PIG-L family deacetylase [Blastococcus sp. VKM Ac-2987]